jgi:hypothetical protein
LNRWRVTLTFDADRLTVALLRWVVALFGSADAPRGLRVRFERVDSPDPMP